VKSTSEQILNVYKDDLIQFKDIVTNDTKKIIADNKEILEKEGAAGITNKLSEGVSSSISMITESIANFDITKITNFTSNEKETDLEKRIRELQQDPKTFTSEPEDPEFVNWKTTFDWNQHKDETQSILATSSDIFLLYSKLVPESLSPQEFWERYYYRLKVHKDEEEKKAALLKGSAPLVSELSWDDDEAETQNEEVQQNTVEEPIKSEEEIPSEPETPTPLQNTQENDNNTVESTTETPLKENTNPPPDKNNKEKGDDWLDWN